MSDTGKAFWNGFLDTSPFILVIAPFGLLFGVVATEAGLSLLETMSMTSLVIAGAAQFTTVALLQEQAPTIVVIITSLAVNLRMAMYSAALVPHLGKTALLTPALKFTYFFGCASALYPFLFSFSMVGALLGKSIPSEYSLDFAIPICFISLLAPMLRSLPHLVAALVSLIAAILLAWMPYNLWLLIAAMLAMVAGAQTELWLKAQKS